MEFGAIKDLFGNIPWILIAVAFGGGFYVARAYPTWFPNLFKPKATNDDLASRLDDIEKKLNAK